MIRAAAPLIAVLVDVVPERVPRGTPHHKWNEGDEDEFHVEVIAPAPLPTTWHRRGRWWCYPPGYPIASGTRARYPSATWHC